MRKSSPNRIEGQPEPNQESGAVRDPMRRSASSWSRSAGVVPNVDCLELQAIGYLGVWLHNRCWLTASALNANLLNWAGGPCTNSAPLGADEETVGAHRAPLWPVGYPRSRILPDVDSRQPTSWIQLGAEVLGQLKSDAQ